MNEAELDRRLGELLRVPEREADQRFIDATIATARLDREMRRASKSAMRRSIIESAVAVTVAATFFLLSQTQPPSADGMISLQAPAMAGLIMLGLWSVVTASTLAGRPLRA